MDYRPILLIDTTLIVKLRDMTLLHRIEKHKPHKFDLHLSLLLNTILLRRTL